MKQLKFFFPLGIICGMITIMLFLASKDCFALEQLSPFSYYEVIEQRNIFRPKIEADNSVQEQKFTSQPIPVYTTSALDKYTLTGIVKIRGKYKATITNKNTEIGHYVGLNDFVDNFKITDIQYDKVILEQDDETYELKINVPASRILYKDLIENEKQIIEPTLPQKPFSSNDQIDRRTNIIKSIRMGIPNVQQK